MEKIKFLNSLLSPGRYSMIWGKHCDPLLLDLEEENSMERFSIDSPGKKEIKDALATDPDHPCNPKIKLLIVNGETNLLFEFNCCRVSGEINWPGTLKMAAWLQKTAEKHNAHILLRIHQDIPKRTELEEEEQDNGFYSSPLFLLAEEALATSLYVRSKHPIRYTLDWKE